MNRSTIYTISPLEKSMAKRHFFMLPPIKPFAFTMLKIIFMNLRIIWFVEPEVGFVQAIQDIPTMIKKYILGKLVD